MPRTPSAFPFSGRRAINPTPPKRVKAWGDGPLRPEVMYPVVEHTRPNRAARNHSRSRAPHHRTQKERSLREIRPKIFCNLFQKCLLYIPLILKEIFSWHTKKYVTERNLYFCLARNLIWPLESPNIFTQSGWPVLFSPNHISYQHQKLKKARETLSRSEILNGNGRRFVCSWIAVVVSYTMRRAI